MASQSPPTLEAQMNEWRLKEILDDAADLAQHGYKGQYYCKLLVSSYSPIYTYNTIDHH
jgi:hypothetical protein